MPSSLHSQEVLFVDCQTTGVNPAHSSLLELGWALGSAKKKTCTTRSFILQQPEGHKVPRRVQEITGITPGEWEMGLKAEAAFKKMFKEAKGSIPWIIHYAKFEKSFLTPFIKGSRKKTPWFCTYEISRRLLPQLSSHSIRAVSGHLGLPIGEMKRSIHHVEATYYIWCSLIEQLKEKEGITTFEDLKSWLDTKAPTKKGGRVYLITSETRLGFPDQPGNYHLKDCKGNVLYVGKATSLRSRVNSYFRGQKTKGSRLNELLAQVADIEVFPCATPLEAALLETDTIKRINPPYNRALKAQKKISFYCDRTLSPTSDTKECRYGPFSSSSWWLHFDLVTQASTLPEGMVAISEEGLTEDLVKQGVELLEKQFALRYCRGLPELKRWLALGFVDRVRNIREQEALKKIKPLEEAPAEEDLEASLELIPWTKERVARRLFRFMGGAAMRIHTARWLRRLATAEIIYQEGASQDKHTLKPFGAFKENVSILALDHVSVLRSELFRVLRQGGKVTLRWPNRTLKGKKLKRHFSPGYFDA